MKITDYSAIGTSNDKKVVTVEIESGVTTQVYVSAEEIQQVAMRLGWMLEARRRNDYSGLTAQQRSKVVFAILWALLRQRAGKTVLNVEID